MRSSNFAYAIAFVAGTVLWAATSVLSKKVEPWDSSAYWTFAYPLAIVLSGVLGYVVPHRPWRWALVVMFTQFIVMLIGGSGLGLLPLGLVVLAILSLPAVVAANVAARIRLGKSDA
jgi:drug/metabolite transporter (DMT)-like permease